MKYILCILINVHGDPNHSNIGQFLYSFLIFNFDFLGWGGGYARPYSQVLWKSNDDALILEETLSLSGMQVLIRS